MLTIGNDEFPFLLGHILKDLPKLGPLSDALSNGPDALGSLARTIAGWAAEAESAEPVALGAIDDGDPDIVERLLGRHCDPER